MLRRSRRLPLAHLAWLIVALGASATFPACSCGGDDKSIPTHAGKLDGAYCELPGSLVFTADGEYLVTGSQDATDLSWLTLPDGFCAHAFAAVPNARQIKVAPGGEIFVASPTTNTTGGGPYGKSAILVLADDDHDGFAEAPKTFLGNLASTQGLLFAKGSLYFQDATAIRRLPYVTGQRSADASAAELVAQITTYVSDLHWPKALDMADDGTIYVGNGGDQGEDCDPSHPFHGGILAIDGSPNGKPVAKGCRNPIAIRCQPGKNRCYAAELAKDYSGDVGGREKILPIRQGDDWGFPCCATRDTPYGDVEPTDCSDVAAEDGAFIIGDTPFGIEFERGIWPAPWKDSAIVALHGAYGSWTGARVVTIETDPTTGELIKADDRDGQSKGGLRDFATGWDDGTRGHGRPAALAMSPDGRLFLANDATGQIIWIAPVGLNPPSHAADAGTEAGAP